MPTTKVFYDELDQLPEGFEFHQETLHDLWDNCICPSIGSIKSALVNIIGVNLLFACLGNRRFLTEQLYHIFSAISGYVLLSQLEFEDGQQFVLVFFISSFMLLQFSRCLKNHTANPYLQPTKFVTFTLIVGLILSEINFRTDEMWLEVRGILMMFAMKLICLAHHLESNNEMPSFLPYFGYVFSGANILFGPWIPFDQYLLRYNSPAKKNFQWIFGIVRAIFLSLVFVSISNCVANYLISDDSNIWMVSYKEALMFRTSHYFISYLSEASMLAAGYRNFNPNDEREWRFVVVRPSVIEFPTSLAIVVTNWNIPMHQFLKKYIYQPALQYGRSIALLMTFLISSMLHGLEIKVTVVLLTIGIFSYVQLLFGKWLSKRFNACLGIHPCKQCHHAIKRDNLICKIGLVILGFITVLHLIFLGIVMDSSSSGDSFFEKWHELSYCSLWIILLNFLLITL